MANDLGEGRDSLRQIALHPLAGLALHGAPDAQPRQETAVVHGVLAKFGLAHTSRGEEFIDPDQEFVFVGHSRENSPEISMSQDGKFLIAGATKIPDICQMVAGHKPEDKFRRRLLELTQGPGQPSLEHLSKAVLKRGKGYLRDYVDKGSPRKLDGDDRAILAQVLGVPERELGPDLSTGVQPAANRNVSVTGDNYDPASPPGRSVPGNPPMLVQGARNLPILGHTKGGEDVFFIDSGKIAGYTMRPHVFDGVSDAYAVEWWDTSMEPWLRDGHLGWVHPQKPAKPGDLVVVQLNDGQALVKTLVRRTETHLVLRQYNPAKDVKIDRSSVKSVHLIVGSLYVAV